MSFFNSQKARKYYERKKKTTKVTTPSSQGTAETIPILGATGSGSYNIIYFQAISWLACFDLLKSVLYVVGDGMPDYKSEFENQPFSQETNDNVLLNPEASGGYYELQELKKSTDQFSEVKHDKF